jgi:hypothetical protein
MPVRWQHLKIAELSFALQHLMMKTTSGTGDDPRAALSPVLRPMTSLCYFAGSQSGLMARPCISHRCLRSTSARPQAASPGRVRPREHASDGREREDRQASTAARRDASMPLQRSLKPTGGRREKGVVSLLDTTAARHCPQRWRQLATNERLRLGDARACQRLMDVQTGAPIGSAAGHWSTGQLLAIASRHSSRRQPAVRLGPRRRLSTRDEYPGLTSRDYR